jgi:TPR repeat protein
MSFDDIPEHAAAVVFSHLGEDPIDRVRLAAVSKVWRSAEKADASLPGGSLRAIVELGRGFQLRHHEMAYKKAIYCYRMAANRGDADAMYCIGDCYLCGECGVEIDETKAVEYFKSASGCGHADATRRLAGWYECGRGVERNEAKAVEIYQKAAELGSGRAALCLGVIYYHGWCGVSANAKEALKWDGVAEELGGRW